MVFVWVGTDIERRLPTEGRYRVCSSSRQQRGLIHQGSELGADLVTQVLVR